MIEINIRLDFSSGNIFPDGNNLGHVGEHNATTLTVTPPPEMAANENIAFYCLAFEVGNDFIKKVVRSALFPKAESFDVKLWQQVTISENLKIQLEAYDTENSLLIKTDYADAVLSPSVNGVQSGTDPSGQSLAGTVAALKAKLDRPTATIETTDVDTFGIELWQDAPIGDGFAVVCNDKTLIPAGTEIKTIEFKIGADGEWVDIRRLYEVDSIPYYLNMEHAIDYDDVCILAVISKTLYGENYLHMAVINGWDSIYIRITYYTDGGENNA